MTEPKKKFVLLISERERERELFHRRTLFLGPARGQNAEADSMRALRVHVEMREGRSVPRSLSLANTSVSV